MKKYPKIKEKDWEKLGIKPIDTNDPADYGYRICPSCKGWAYKESRICRCATCKGFGEVQWGHKIKCDYNHWEALAATAKMLEPLLPK